MQAKAEDSQDSREEDSRDLTVALMRVFRLVKRLHTQSDDAVPVWVLHVVQQHQPIRLSDVAAHLHLDLSTTSRHVSALESLGRLSREPDPDDRRATRISLTGEGEAELQRKFAERCRRVGEVVQEWAKSDVRDFEQQLARFAADLEARDPGLSDSPCHPKDPKDPKDPKEKRV